MPIDQPTILTIDDEPIVIMALKLCLEDEGYQIFSAPNGKEGLEIFKQINPQIIILDLKMPVMNSMKFLENIDHNPQDSYAIIVLTGHGDNEDDVEKCFSRGVSAFVRKPFSEIELKGSIRNSLALLQYQRELSDAENKTAIASQAKSEFLANMSHEIRTPLNVILGMADLLLDSELNRAQQIYVRSFQKAGINLLNIIRGIFDLTKIEKNQLAIAREVFDLCDLIKRVSDITAISAHGKGLEMICRIESGLPHFLEGDPFRIRQVLLYLLDNAVKFTTHGEIILDVKKCSKNSGSKNISLMFSVRDTGVGIAPDKLQNIFQVFSQGDISSSKQHQGAGLGLTLAQKLTLLMNGQIEVTCPQSGGTIFNFTLPLDRLETKKPTKIADLNLNGINILLAEENQTNSNYLAEIILGWGAKVATSHSCEASYSLLEKSSFDLILIDSKLTGSGCQNFLQFLNEHTGDKKPRTIIMLPSNFSKQQIQNISNCNDTDYLLKPIKLDELQDKIFQSLSMPMQASVNMVDRVDKTSKNGSPPKPKILLAEDSEDNVLLALAFLKKVVSSIEVAKNGQEAVEKFKDGNFDLVLMDMQMPIMDGYEATKKIREIEAERGGKKTPIIALTAYALDEEERKSLAAGCEVHMPKPFKKKMLIETIQSILSTNN